MAKAPETQKTTASVSAFIDAIEDRERRADAKALLNLMKAASRDKVAMWGEAIVGFGSYTTSTGDWPLVGFSPRKGNSLRPARDDQGESETAGPARQAQGRHRAPLHDRLADIDADVLSEIVTWPADAMRKKG